MALPNLPQDGLNPWGSPLRDALIDISNRADQGISDAGNAQTDVDSLTTTVDANGVTLSSNTTRISTLETSVATKAADSSVVKLSGNQTISGTKTFNSSLVVPDNSFAISKVSGLQVALNSKAPLDSPAFTGNVSGITKTMVGLSLVDNTTDLDKPVSTSTQTALNLKADTSDLNNQIQSHNHTGGVNGVAIPISAVTNLQNSLNAKQNTIKVSTGSASDITFDSTMWSVPYCWLYRQGAVVYVSLYITSKQAIQEIPSGNISNILIGNFKTTSEFANIYTGATGNANFGGNTYSLSTSSDGLLASGFVKYDGSIILSATAPTAGSQLDSGYTFSLCGVYMLNSTT